MWGQFPPKIFYTSANVLANENVAALNLALGLDNFDLILKKGSV